MIDTREYNSIKNFEKFDSEELERFVDFVYSKLDVYSFEEKNMFLSLYYDDIIKKLENPAWTLDTNPIKNRLITVAPDRDTIYGFIRNYFCSDLNRYSHIQRPTQDKYFLHTYIENNPIFLLNYNYAIDQYLPESISPGIPDEYIKEIGKQHLRSCSRYLLNKFPENLISEKYYQIIVDNLGVTITSSESLNYLDNPIIRFKFKVKLKDVLCLSEDPHGYPF